MADVETDAAMRKQFKQKMNRQLEPIMVMLMNRKQEMPTKAWLEFIRRTEEAVLRHPEEYLVTVPDSPLLLQELVHEIFERFMSEVHR